MQFLSEITPDIIITFAVLLAVLILFAKNYIPPHMAAMVGLAVLLTSGVIDTQGTLSVFSNAATITIACMFILSAALERTGVIDLLGRGILNLAEKHHILSVVCLLAMVTMVSAFMNNTPVVIILSPIVIAVARQLQNSPSKYLIPLSYMAILGGTCTLIGTSTNILADGIATAHGLPPFSMFEVSGPGLAMAFVGAVYLATFGHKLLPDRDTLQQQLLSEPDRKRFLAEAIVQSESPLIGKTLNEIRFSSTEDYEILDLVRNDSGARNGLFNIVDAVRGLRSSQQSSAGNDGKGRSTFRDIPLQAGDRIVFKTYQDQLLEIRESSGISFDIEGGNATYTSLTTRETTITEGVIGPNSHFVGQTPASLRLRRRYGSYILAVHRDHRNITTNFESFRLRYGDVLLIEGPADELDRLFTHENLQPVSRVPTLSVDVPRAILAVLTIFAVVGLAALQVMPIAGLAIPGAIFVILAGCVTLEQAYEAIEWRILMMIFGMLAVSLAMQESGAAEMIVMGAAHMVEDLGPVAILATVFLLTSILTELMSNNATAVLMTPIVIGLAAQTGLEPRPLVVAVMLGASASFATPIGYQTNTYVYNIGNYHFNDFLKVGLPMNLLMLVVATLVIPMVWPLTTP